MGRRIAYGFLGVAIGLLITLAFDAVRRPHVRESAIVGAIGLCISCASIIIGIAERQGKVKSIEDMHRPLTLFRRSPK
jgi:hypothetical protein